MRGANPLQREDVTLERLEERMREMRTPQHLDEYETWLRTLSPQVQEPLRSFPPWQLYRVRAGAPYRFTVAGSIVAIHRIVELCETVEPHFRVLRSPIGYAGVLAHIAPCWLEPVTLDDLKQGVN